MSYGEDECTVVVLDGEKSLFRSTDLGVRTVFREGWDKVEEEWSSNPRPLVIEMTVGESRLTVHTRASSVVQRTRCECPICGWDEARKAARRIEMADSLGLLWESPVEALIADGPRTLSAVWVDIRCSMCLELDAAGLDRVTKRPIAAAK